MDKVAILIDGGYFLKRLPTVCPTVDSANAKDVTKAIARLVYNHLKSHNKLAGGAHIRSSLYRVFYYDAKPYTGKEHKPVSKLSVDYSKSNEARFRLALFEELRKSPNTAVRLGHVIRERGWVLGSGFITSR